MWPFRKKPIDKSSPQEGFQLFENQYADTPVDPDDYPKCDCYKEFYAWEDRFDEVENDEEYEQLESEKLVWQESLIHIEDRFRSQRAWDIAREIIDEATRCGRKELNLGKVMDRVDYMALNTLPESIGSMKDLEVLILYGSNLTSIPREISGCENLRSFQPYTSYRLHWFPYEIKQCKKLSESCVSTRALYGNYKNRPPFPDLSAVQYNWPSSTSRCSICCNENAPLDQYWTSQVVATDVLPLLVSVCSISCEEKISEGAKNYLKGHHKGGLGLEQPASEYIDYS